MYMLYCTKGDWTIKIYTLTLCTYLPTLFVTRCHHRGEKRRPQGGEYPLRLPVEGDSMPQGAPSLGRRPQSNPQASAPARRSYFYSVVQRERRCLTHPSFGRPRHVVFPCRVLARRGTSGWLARNRLEHDRSRVDGCCSRAIRGVGVMSRITSGGRDGKNSSRPRSRRKTRARSIEVASLWSGGTAVPTRQV